MENQVLTSVPNTKIPLKVKLAFSVSNFGKMAGSTLISAYAVFYYTTLMGLDGTIVGTIILISKIWDVINDPMMGVLCDRTKSKGGKCRFWLKHSAVPGGIIVALMFMIPDLTTPLQYAWLAVTYVLQSMAHTALGIPQNALMGRLSTDIGERTKLNQIAMFFSLAGTYGVIGLTTPLATAIGGENMKLGFAVVGIIIGVLYAASFLIAWAGTKGCEPAEFLAADYAEEKGAKKQEEQVSIGTSLKALLPNTYWFICIGMMLLYVLSGGLGQTSMAQYYMYNMGNINLMSLDSSLGLVSLILSLALLNVFTKKFGNAGSIFLGGVIGAAGLALRLVTADGILICWGIGVFLMNFGGGIVNSLIILCVFDARVYGKWKTGIDNDAVLMSGTTTASKVGFAVTSSLAAMLLSAVNYDPSLEQQTDAVLNLLFTEQVILQLIGYVLVAGLALIAVRFEKRIPQMRKEIEEREQAAVQEVQ